MENNSQEEIWKDIEDYEGLYQVSSLGRVKSLERFVDDGKGGTRLVKGRILSPSKVRGDYLQVILCKEGKPTAFSVHRLVYEAFHGKIPEGMQVNHIDEDKSNNSLNNLNLMTPKENTNWGSAIERRSTNRINHKSLSKAVLQLDLQGNFLAEYPSQSEAERKLGIRCTAICACCKGKQKTAGSYIFRYKTA